MPCIPASIKKTIKSAGVVYLIADLISTLLPLCDPALWESKWPTITIAVVRVLLFAGKGYYAYVLACFLEGLGDLLPAVVPGSPPTDGGSAAGARNLVDAVTGEATGIAMGLVKQRSKSATAIEDMVGYAQETRKKILQVLASGISLVMFGRLEAAADLIRGLCNDKDALLRRSGMHTIAMAYGGSGNNKAIRRLLHVAVSDVNDDVRRAAVEAIGFILFRTPEQCPGVVSQLSESSNPHVRCGAAMALGICCDGTGNKEAVALLEPMINDPVNYVRQGALIDEPLD